MQVSRSKTISIFINFDNLNGKKTQEHKMAAAVAKLAEQLTDDSMFEALNSTSAGSGRKL